MAREIFKNLPDKTTPLNATKLNGVFNGEEAMGSIVVDDITCKNIIPNNAVSATKNGITLTVNKDKSITLKGTATAQTIFSLTTSRIFSLKAGEYTLSTGIVLPTGVRLEVWYSSATNLMNILSGYSQYLFNIASNTTYSQFRSQLVINSGTTVDMTIKYMLEKGPVATDYVEHKEFSNKQIYSTSEQVIGTWFGKPLYRKTFTLTPNIGTETASAITLDLSNVDIAMIDTSHSYILDTANSKGYMTFPNINGNTAYNAGGYVQVTGGVPTLNIRKGESIAIYTLVLTLEYTKTTD